MGEENESMRKRIVQLEQANSALLARNKVLEINNDEGLQQAVQAGVQNKLQKANQNSANKKSGPQLTVIKNELPGEYTEKMESLKAILRSSRLSQSNMRTVEHLLRDNGADYFKITRDEGNVEMKLYQQFDLIWKYHGLTEDFMVFIDFD